MAVWRLLLVPSALVVYLKCGEENKSENKFKDEEPRCRFVENAVQVAELHPNHAGCQNCRNEVLQHLLQSAAPSNRPMGRFGRWRGLEGTALWW